MQTKWSLWLRWVLANALGELVGLCVPMAAFALLATQLWDITRAGPVLAVFALDVAASAFEATTVGLLQWWAMHPWLSSITRRSWWLATLGGSLVAFGVSILPPMLMSMRSQGVQAPMTEPSQGNVLLLAAGMGLVTGAVIAFAQWFVLRGKVMKAGLWIPANMLAWAFGTPVIFWTNDIARQGQPIWLSVLLTSGGLLLTGAVVGAVQGAFLVSLLKTGKS